MHYCKCMRPMGIKPAIEAIYDEMVEFVEDPSADEFSDIMFGFGRLFAALVGRTYFRMPFDARHVKKVEGRMGEHGCIRSLRHVRNGNGCVEG